LFYFCALAFCDGTDFPAIVELGTVTNQEVKIHTFRNRFDAAALSMFPLPDDPSHALDVVLRSIKNTQLAGLGEESAREFWKASSGRRS
jgi:hypothetical protein